MAEEMAVHRRSTQYRAARGVALRNTTSTCGATGPAEVYESKRSSTEFGSGARLDELISDFDFRD